MTPTAMVLEGSTIEEARSKIWMFDIDGLLANERPEGNLEGHKKYYAKDHAPTKDFAGLVNEIKPSILIGQFLNNVSTVHNIFGSTLFIC